MTVRYRLLHIKVHNEYSNSYTSPFYFLAGQQKPIHRIESLTRNMLKTAGSAGAGSPASSDHTRGQHAHRCWETESAENHRKSVTTAFSHGVLYKTAWRAHVRGQHSKDDTQHCQHSLRTAKLRTSLSTTGCADFVLRQGRSSEADSRPFVSCLLCSLRQNWQIYCHGESKESKKI